MSEVFTEFVNLCYSATIGTISFDVVSTWLAKHRANHQYLFLTEGPIDFLLKLKAPVNVLQTLLSIAPELPFKMFSEGRTVLHLAACSCVSIEVMEHLLEQNIAALMEQDSLGNLPIHCAVKHFAPYEVIAYLTNRHPPGRGRGRNPLLAINGSGQTPLHIACSSNPRVFDAIVRHPMNDSKALNIRDMNGNLPLHLACFNRYVWWPESKVVSTLLRSNRESLQIPNNDGNLPLHMACAANQLPHTIRQLLNEHFCYAFPDATKVKNKEGKLPLHVACENNANVFTIRGLLYYYPDAVSIQDNNGDLPIHLYCRRFHSGLDLEKLDLLLVANPSTLCVRNKEHKYSSCYIDFGLEDTYFSKAQDAIIGGHSVYSLQLILQEFPEVSSSWIDEKGNSLLHHACMKSGAEVSIATIVFLVNWLPDTIPIANKDGKMPKDLLKEAASYKDNAGMLLLHHLLATGDVPWMHTVDLTVAVINFVIDAYSNSITVPDNNGMLPFHHACISMWCGIDELFTVLQGYPDSLRVTPSMDCVVTEPKRIKLS